MTIVGALPFQLQNGTTADATQVMADFNKIVTDTNTNAAHNGVNTDITALTALNTPIPTAAGATNVYIASTSGGTANAQTVASPTPSGFTLVVGNRICFVAGFTNTAAMTLNVNATGATNVFKPSPSGPIALVGGEVVAGNYVEAVFDGTQFQLYTNVSMPIGGPSTAMASAATVDLGTAASHFVVIGGTTTITSFGSSASLTYPLYFVEFNGVLTLTYNGSTLIVPGTANITTAAGDTMLVRYLGAGGWAVLIYQKANGQPLSFNPTFIQNYISGLTLSTAGSSGTMSIAAGVASDSTNAQMMVGAASSKTTASWVVGSGNGGLDTGAIANSTWYHFYEIMRLDTGVVDYIFSLSASAPTLPTGYTLFRRIGSGKTDGSAHWILFYQAGDSFVWAAPVTDVNATNPGVGPTVRVLASVPTGVIVDANIAVNCTAGSSVNGETRGSVYFPSTGAPTYNFGGFPTSTTVNHTTVTPLTVRTDQFAQVKTVLAASDASVVFAVITLGWTDRRGKQ